MKFDESNEICDKKRFASTDTVNKINLIKLIHKKV